MATGMQELHRYRSSDVRQRQRGKDHASADHPRSRRGRRRWTARYAHSLDALRSTNGVLGGSHGAAVRLGMKRTTLASRMATLGIFHQRGTTSR